MARIKTWWSTYSGGGWNPGASVGVIFKNLTSFTPDKNWLLYSISSSVRHDLVAGGQSQWLSSRITIQPTVATPGSMMQYTPLPQQSLTDYVVAENIFDVLVSSEVGIYAFDRPVVFRSGLAYSVQITLLGTFNLNDQVTQRLAFEWGYDVNNEWG